jgi:hypothetical protein
MKRSANIKMSTPAPITPSEARNQPLPPGAGIVINRINAELRKSAGRFERTLFAEFRSHAPASAINKADFSPEALRAASSFIRATGQYHVQVLQLGIEGPDSPPGKIDDIQTVILVEEKKGDAPPSIIPKLTDALKPGSYDTCAIHAATVLEQA